MKKKVLIVLFSVFVAGFYAQAQAQKVNVVSVSKERDIHNFYTMMKEAFPLAYNDPAAPRFIFFDTTTRSFFIDSRRYGCHIAESTPGLSQRKTFELYESLLELRGVLRPLEFHFDIRH